MNSSWVTSVRQKSGIVNAVFSSDVSNSKSTKTRPFRLSWKTSTSAIRPLWL